MIYKSQSIFLINLKKIRKSHDQKKSIDLFDQSENDHKKSWSEKVTISKSRDLFRSIDLFEIDRNFWKRSQKFQFIRKNYRNSHKNDKVNLNECRFFDFGKKLNSLETFYHTFSKSTFDSRSRFKLTIQHIFFHGLTLWSQENLQCAESTFDWHLRSRRGEYSHCLIEQYWVLFGSRTVAGLLQDSGRIYQESPRF